MYVYMSPVNNVLLLSIILITRFTKLYSSFRLLVACYKCRSWEPHSQSDSAGKRVEPDRNVTCEPMTLITSLCVLEEPHISLWMLVIFQELSIFLLSRVTISQKTFGYTSFLSNPIPSSLLGLLRFS